MLILKYIPRSAVLFFVAVFLSSCVTTTTGGFLTDASDERAVEDYIQLALAYFDADDMGGARRHANNALNIDDKASQIYVVLALISQREGDLDLADDNYRRAISLDRGNSMARNNYAAMLYGQERYLDAFEQLQAVTQDTSYDGRPIAFENFGRSALRLERLSDAQNAFERAVQLDSNLYISALELALIYFDQQQFDQAKALYQSYLTTVNFYQVPHTPRALLAGIRIEGHFQNQKLVDDFALILRTLYQSSPEYQAYQRLSDAF